MSLAHLLGRGFGGSEILPTELVGAIKKPEATSISGCVSPRKERSLNMVAGTVTAFNWPLFDEDDQPVDPQPDPAYIHGQDASNPPTRSAMFYDVFRESCGVHYGKIMYNEDDGLTILPPLEVRTVPSIYKFDLFWLQPEDAGSLQLHGSGVISVEQSILNIHNSGQPYFGPLSLREVRRALRDFVEDNDILGRKEFEDAEIMDCLLRPIAYWNETPPTTVRHSPVEFPYRERWLRATAALLAEINATWMMRNAVPVKGEGISADDRATWRDQLAIAQKAWKEYEVFVFTQKRTQNISSGFRIC